MSLDLNLGGSEHTRIRSDGKVGKCFRLAGARPVSEVSDRARRQSISPEEIVTRGSERV